MIDKGFLSELRRVCRSSRPDCFLVGEMIHGPYSRLLGSELLDAATGYQIYKSTWSSFNDANMYELKNVLDQAFNPSWGQDKASLLMNFLGNHDTTRIRSILKDERGVIPAFLILFTLNGIPTVYYGDEIGLRGVKSPESDADVRRAMPEISGPWPEYGAEVFAACQRIIRLRKENHGLCRGDIIPVFADNVQCNVIAYLRRSSQQLLLVVVNAGERAVSKTIPLWNQNLEGVRFTDILNKDGTTLTVQNNQLQIAEIPPFWGKVLLAV
jgi:glycosidase